ncbi:MAG: hypothetical protein PSX81_06030 [bacterium]|nr:hypothetical protein [bacterium]
MTIFKSINKRKRFVSFTLLSVFLIQILVPLKSFALTGGPSQPEVQSFQPIGVSDMVDPFTGDFSYNLPLLDIDGYPINMVYNSGVSTDAEASWVGLGWNLNPGVINRNMRGLPDDFNGDVVTKELNMRPNRTIGFNGGVGGELFGLDVINGSVGMGISYNNYNGVGIETSVNASFSAGDKSKGRMTAGLGLSSSSENGLTISPNLSFQAQVDQVGNRDKFAGIGIGTSFNSRAGLGDLSIDASASSSVHGAKTSKGSEARSSHGGPGSSIKFGVNSYSPSAENSMVNYSVNFSVKFGVELYGLDGTINFGGYYSMQKLKDRTIKTPAYGYLNMQNAALEGSENNGLLDFNREKDGTFNVNTSNLPLSSYTYDILSINGHGIGGSFRPFRNDIGAVSDPLHRNTSLGGSLGGEEATGGLFKVGLDLHVNYTNSQSNIWNGQNRAKSNIKFRQSIGDAEGAFEPVFYKQTGELSVDDESEFSDKFMKAKPIRISLEKAGIDVYTKNEFADKDGNTLDISDKMYRKKRVKRGQALTYLKRSELSKYALIDYKDKMYSAPDHHISEVSVVRTDGARYYYGIPAYNITQEQTSFAMGSGGGDRVDIMGRRSDEKGLIRYDYGDNTKDNKRGINNYYNSEITPAYAHSYLLTAIISPEYTDIDGIRGPSKGDLGNYTLFEYKKLTKPYNWRVPYEQMQANYNEGIKSDITDDQGNYQYGEKEIWYLEKIITKNTVAVFTTESRHDAFSVKDRDGGMGANSISMHLLRKISLYSKPDYDLLGASAVPIKEVHFEYDYSLCSGIPNNDGAIEMIDGVNVNLNKGKLALKKIYFTYGKSYRAKFSPYTFIYHSFNPTYSLKAYDRWGNYKSNALGSLVPKNNPVHTSEYPYVGQDTTVTNKNSRAWQLSNIMLPSGGQIKVSYEADDYAFVQDKKAMQMFKINSIGSDINSKDFLSQYKNSLMESYNKLNPLDPSSNKINGYLTIKLQKAISTSSYSLSSASDLFKTKYLNGIDNLYFRVLGNITDKEAHYDYVSGYASIDLNNCGVLSSVVGGDYDYGYIKIKDVAIGDNTSSSSVNPISKAIWQYGRTRCSRIVNDQPTTEEPGDNVIQVYKAITNASPIKNIREAFLGPNRTMQNKDFGKNVILNKSFIRLNTPDGFKLGGGNRVKKIEISDEWQSMVSTNPTYSYGQEYSYTIQDDNNPDVLISSGVAAYEPALGGDENPWKQPVWSGDKDEKLLVPDDKSYTESPFGESFFPAPSVGYSKVTVKNLQYSGVKRHATGYVVNEFYTAKDFPTIVDYTGIDFKPYKTKRIWSILNKSCVDYMTTSQGYTIELNDMHGKQKANWVYAEDADKPISGIEYKYNCERYQDRGFKLKNDATIIRKDGTIDTKEIGVEYDVFVDFREEDSKTYGGGLNFNMASFLAILFPAIVPTVMPQFNVEETRYRSAVVTKLVCRYGLVKETIAYDLGSSVPTKNLAYDAENGQVLLTMTKNEFEDDIYNFQYPAHWYYDQMGAAYKNLGAEIDATIDVNGEFTMANAKDFFVPGDEVSVGEEKGWVTNVSIVGKVTMVNFLGKPYNPAGTHIKILRSGRRNVIAANIGTIATTVNPLNSLSENNISGVLSASAQVFKEGWKTYCECFTSQNDIVYMSKNPYVNGQKGTFRPYRAYAYLTDRTHTLVNSNTNIRTDGLYANFTPYWQVNGGLWGQFPENWQWTTEITEYGPYGEELENMDALFRYSSAIFGYNHSLPSAVAANAKRRAIAFDGMEDYDFITCSSDHFSYKTAINRTIENDAHTGKKSLKVNSGANSTVTKTIGNPCN